MLLFKIDIYHTSSVLIFTIVLVITVIEIIFLKLIFSKKNNFSFHFHFSIQVKYCSNELFHFASHYYYYFFVDPINFIISEIWESSFYFLYLVNKFWILFNHWLVSHLLLKLYIQTNLGKNLIFFKLCNKRITKLINWLKNM